MKTKRATSKQMVPQREIHYTQATDSDMKGKELIHLVLVDPHSLKSIALEQMVPQCEIHYTQATDSDMTLW